MEREVGGGIRVGNTCKPMAVSFQCMTKSTTIKKIMIIKKKKKDGNNNPICKTEKGTQMYRPDFWTLWEKARVGCFESRASKHVYYQG